MYSSSFLLLTQIVFRLWEGHGNFCKFLSILNDLGFFDKAILLMTFILNDINDKAILCKC